MSYADIGSARIRAQHYESHPSEDARRYDRVGGNGGNPALVGFTQPTLIYDQMRRMDLDATSLDTDMRVHVADPRVKSSWAAWFKDWKTFFAKTLTESGKFANLFATDDLREIVNSRDAELAAFHTLYAHQLDETGAPVPPSASPGAPPPLSHPGKPPPDDKKEPWYSIPWWGYALGAVALGGVGYSFYRAAKRAKAQAAWGEKYLATNVMPHVLPGSEPMPMFHRDPSTGVLIPATMIPAAPPA